MEYELKRSSKMMDDKSQKSQAKSDQHHSHSKNQLEVSSETDEYYNNESRGNNKEIKKKKRSNQLNVSNEKVKLINKQKNELKN